MKVGDLFARGPRGPRGHRPAPQPAGTKSDAPDRTRITQVFRNAPQMRVVARLLRASGPPSLRVAIYGVADGAEAVSLLIMLDPAVSPIDLRIEGRDINAEYLEHAATFRFPANHFARGYEPGAFPAYLERSGSVDWQLRSTWRPSISYEFGNVLSLRESASSAAYDAVLCQNTLVVLSPEDCTTAMQGLAGLVRPGGLLVVGGGPLDRIPGLAAAEGFEAVLDDVEAIHEGWTIQRRFFANEKPPCWALEPFNASHPDGPRRYATIFRKALG